MRKLIILMALLLLLPIGFDSTPKADEILPPDPGLDDGDNGDDGKDGDHPWGEENSDGTPDRFKPRNKQRTTIAFEDVIYYSIRSYFEFYLGQTYFTTIKRESGISDPLLRSKRDRVFSSTRLSSRRGR